MPINPSHVGTGYQGYSFVNLLQDCLTCGAVTVDLSGTILAVTPEAAKLLSADARQPSAVRLPESLQAIAREAQAAGQVIANRTVELRDPQQGLFDVSVTAVPAASATAAAPVILVLKALCPTGKVDHHLHRLDRLSSIGTLAASMAHEIKNALVPVRTFVDLLLEKNPDAELAETVRREMQRVDAIVSRMLKFAAPAKPVFASVRLHEILKHSLRLVQHRVEGRSISFVHRFDAGSDSFSGDDHQLEQAFVNLLLNAVDAMGSGGTLTVSTEVLTERTEAPLGNHAAGYLCVKIADTGTGIDPEHVTRIFEPFFTTKESGTGLGLAITRRIIEEHNGIIRVQSERGKGTTFAVLFPVARA